VKITVTVHDAGRAFRITRERGISMKQALDIHDPFALWLNGFDPIDYEELSCISSK
jgi:hypothetical protein